MLTAACLKKFCCTRAHTQAPSGCFNCMNAIQVSLRKCSVLLYANLKRSMLRLRPTHALPASTQKVACPSLWPRSCQTETCKTSYARNRGNWPMLWQDLKASLCVCWALRKPTPCWALRSRLWTRCLFLQHCASAVPPLKKKLLRRYWHRKILLRLKAEATLCVSLLRSLVWRSNKKTVRLKTQTELVCSGWH